MPTCEPVMISASIIRSEVKAETEPGAIGKALESTHAPQHMQIFANLINLQPQNSKEACNTLYA